MGVYNESQLDEGREATSGQYHRFSYVDKVGISSYLTTKLIALLSPNPLLNIVTMASAAANMEGGIREMATPPHQSTLYYPKFTDDAKEVVKTITSPTNNLTHIMCSHRQWL